MRSKALLTKFQKGVRVRPIHVVIAEASVVAYDYSEDWGLSAVLGESGERLAGGLTNALIEKIEKLLKCLQLQGLNGAKATIQFHYLGLALAFRALGGFPTRWMYPNEFHLNDPRPRTASFPVEPSERKAILKRTDLEELFGVTRSGQIVLPLRARKSRCRKGEGMGVRICLGRSKGTRLAFGEMEAARLCAPA
jgi:hypothetical protein